jgi:hypothetical protein
MLKIRLAIVLLAIALFSSGAAAAPACGKLPTKAGIVGYCIDATDRSKNPDILYYLHGAFPAGTLDPEKAGVVPENDLLKFWVLAHVERPTIVTISWGPTWVLKDDKLAAFEHEIVPQLEAMLTQKAEGRRMVLGSSMGGLNAFLAWTAMPHLFQAAAFQCPAFTPFSPFANGLEKVARAHEIASASTRGAVQQVKEVPERYEQLDLFAEIFSPFFVSTEEWLAYQPKAVVALLAGRALPPAYLIHNAQDQFGFDGAPEITAAGLPVTIERLSGKHCADDWTIGLAKFLSSHPVDPALAQ